MSVLSVTGDTPRVTRVYARGSRADEVNSCRTRLASLFLEMLVAICVHLQSGVPPDVLPLGIKPPVIPLFVVLLDVMVAIPLFSQITGTAGQAADREIDDFMTVPRSRPG